MSNRDNTAGQFKTLFMHSLDALLIIDAESERILEVNRTAHRLLGYTRKEIIGKRFTSLLPPMTEDSRKSKADEIKTFGAVFVQEFLRADGSHRVMDMTFTMIPWDCQQAILATLRDVTERVKVEEERERLIRDLQEAMEKIKTLKGLLPICANCKKIRNDDGYWQQIEVYIHEHSDADFTHGICPECMKTLYPEFYDENDEKQS